MIVRLNALETSYGLSTASADANEISAIVEENQQSAHAAESAIGVDLAASVLWKRWIGAHMRLAARSERL